MSKEELELFLQDENVQESLEAGMEYLQERWDEVYVYLDDVPYNDCAACSDEDIAMAIVVALAKYSRRTNIQELAKEAQELGLYELIKKDETK